MLKSFKKGLGYSSKPKKGQETETKNSSEDEASGFVEGRPDEAVTPTVETGTSTPKSSPRSFPTPPPQLILHSLSSSTYTVYDPENDASSPASVGISVIALLSCSRILTFACCSSGPLLLATAHYSHYSLFTNSDSCSACCSLLAHSQITPKRLLKPTHHSPYRNAHHYHKKSHPSLNNHTNIAASASS
jgi:hypothetical protein